MYSDIFRDKLSRSKIGVSCFCRQRQRVSLARLFKLGAWALTSTMADVQKPENNDGTSARNETAHRRQESVGRQVGGPRLLAGARLVLMTATPERKNLLLLCDGVVRELARHYLTLAFSSCLSCVTRVSRGGMLPRRTKCTCALIACHGRPATKPSAGHPRGNSARAAEATGQGCSAVPCFPK